jgi:hypothetical protein
MVLYKKLKKKLKLQYISILGSLRSNVNWWKRGGGGAQEPNFWYNDFRFLFELRKVSLKISFLLDLLLHTSKLLCMLLSFLFTYPGNGRLLSLAKHQKINACSRHGDIRSCASDLAS